MSVTLWLLALVPVAALIRFVGIPDDTPHQTKPFLRQIFDGLCYTILRFLHLAFAVNKSFQSWVQMTLLQNEADVHDLLLSDRPALVEERMELEIFLLSLPQRPEHFAVVLPDGHTDDIVDDVEALCAWSGMAKIPRLTVYTRDGRLKDSADAIEARLRKSKIISRAYDNKPPSIILDLGTHHAKRHITSPGNHPLHVSLWSREDGFPALVELSRSLAKQVSTGTLSAKSIDETMVASLLKDPFGFAHPELLLLYDDLLCIPEFPPWQLQNTEVYQIGQGSVKSLGDAVVRALGSYAKIEKRWGK
ncbi:hypothetical protein LPJ66_001173 [Kickxella alabastrina]|uniref:Uncharacterized protein n=1 Tax=Kickxella alabastrina TaxID=61397 RepID=A0ACC1IU14_9FUNG|nr:hypothetical protein LPJ66_001173 [Kickxella alabastrina]